MVIDTPGVSLDSEAAYAFVEKVCKGIKVDSANKTIAIVDRDDSAFTDQALIDATETLEVDASNKADMIVFVVHPDSLETVSHKVGIFRRDAVNRAATEPLKLQFNRLASAIDTGRQRKLWCGNSFMRLNFS